MKPVRVITGNCLDAMPTLDAASVDAIVCDPPYGLRFMGKGWDRGVPGEPFWREALRVAKPGAHLVAFGGTRTYHRLTCAIEDAGWEIRDCLSWLYGSGFPKSHNGPWGGTALKPAWEPIILARKPLVSTVAGNVQQHGTGALNIDGCRIGFASDADERESKEKNQHADFGSGPRENEVFGTDRRDRESYDAPGRWPANVMLDENAARTLDDQTGELSSGFMAAGTEREGIGYRGGLGGQVRHDTHGDTGGASRFFYTAKASRAERNAGLDGLPAKRSGMVSNTSGQHMTRRDGGAPQPAANHHPTVKPLALMQWLCRLVTPRGGLILDPFCGSGTTGRAAVAEGFGFLGIEDDEEYAAIARARIAEYAPLLVRVEGA